MRSRLRVFALVGLVATAIDLGIFLALRNSTALGNTAADIVALAVAATVSYALNRFLTFRGEANARWIAHPGMFASTAILAGAVDLVVLSAMIGAGASALIAKVMAIGVAGVVRWFAYRWILLTQVRRELGQRVDRPTVSAPLRLTVVIPAYNEGERVAETIRALDQHLSHDMASSDFELLVVDDGSSDDTADIAKRAGAAVCKLDKNRGKGAAVKAGVLSSQGQTVVFTDADLAYPPALISRAMSEIEAGWDIVVGSRRHSDTKTVTSQRSIRKLGGWVVNRFTHLVLLGQFRDTQCGLKGFRGDIAKVIFERVRIDGFAFDVEVFAIAEQDQLSLTEIPVVVQNRSGSSVSLIADSWSLLRDLVQVRRWVGAGLYKPSSAQQTVLSSRSA